MQTPEALPPSVSTPQPVSGPPWFVMAGVFLALFLALYWQATGYGFLNFLENTAFLAHPEVAENQKLDWAFSSSIPWQPAAWISHMTDFALFGLKGGAHRTVSLLLHVLNVLLVFMVFRRLTGAFGPSLATALLWGLHPMRVEPVVWLVERRMLLATTFVLLAMLAYPGVLAPRRRWWHWAAFLGAALAAAASHPVGAALPVLLVVIEPWLLKRQESLGARLREKWPLWLMTAVTVALVARGAAQPDANWILGPLSFGERLVLALKALLLEAPGKTLLPHPLSALYWQTPGTMLLVYGLCTGALALLAAARRPFLLGVLWFVAALIPSLGWIHPELAAWGDRGTYLAHIGPIAAAVWVAAEFRSRGHLAMIAVGIAWAGLTGVRVPAWETTHVALQNAVEQGGGHPLARFLLAQAFIAQNLGVDAEKELLELIKERPRAIEARLLLGSALALQQRFREGADVYREVIRQAPNRPDGYYGLGMMQTNLKEVLPGIESFGEAIKRGLGPTQEATAENAIALYWLGQQKWAVAEQHARRAWQLVPSFANAHRNYAVALARQDKSRQAFNHLERARLWTKEDPQVVEIWSEVFNKVALEEKKRVEQEELERRGKKN